VSLILPSLASAAGLGKLSVLSQLGQPLRAEIEIVSLQRGEGDTLGARLAAGELFRQANIDLNPALLSVKFAVQRRPGGQYVMTLTSGQPVNEPFIDMLVELNWANGRLVREYTFLLDPPEYAGPRKRGPPRAAQPLAADGLEPIALAPPAPDDPIALAPPVLELVPAPPEAPAEPSTPSQTAVVELAPPAPDAGGGSEPVQADVQVLPADVKPAEPVLGPVDAEPALPGLTKLVQEPGISDSYEVVRGDTLSKIAVRNQVEGVTLQQMLVALFRANQEAFVADNMNRLRAGKIINIPDKDTTRAVAAADARRIVSAQYADFNEYRRSLGIAVASTPASQGGRQASGQIGAPKDETPVPPKEPTKDELRLSRADDAKRSAKAAGTAAADDLAAKDNALKEARERIALLEKNLQDMQKLAQIKSQTGAQLQQQAEAAKSAAAAKPSDPAKAAAAAKAEAPKAPEPAKAVAKAEAPKAPEPAKAAPKAPEVAKPPEPAKAKAPEVAKAPEPAKAPESAKAPETAKAPEPAKTPESAAKAPEVAKAPEPAKASPKAAAKAKSKAAPPPIEVSFVDELLDNPMALGGAGVSMLLLAGYAAYAWRRKRNSQFENSIMSVVPSDADSVLGSVGGRNVDTSASSIQSDFGQGGASKADTEEIDPIAEADVYMAYGRDAQAEEILKDALAKDSSRQAIRVKLLEIYANRKDARSFEAAANELRAATGGHGAEWEKVAGLGLSIDPANALYGGKPGTAPHRFNETAQMPAFGTSTAQMPAFSTSTEPSLEDAAPLNIDFDIGASTSGGAAPLPDLDLGIGSASAAESAAGLDFDLGLGADKTATVGAPVAASAVPPSEPALSIDFDLPMGDKPAAPAVSSAPASDLGTIDFDLGTPSGGGDAKTPAAPSVDLAAISLDLGTPGGNGSGGVPDARWQEVATKLDLAKAYEEMGDKDGARELLKEVVKEGDTAQQQQAQTMLQALG
jgi:pilus assembly protein FimV